MNRLLLLNGPLFFSTPRHTLPSRHACNLADEKHSLNRAGASKHKPFDDLFAFKTTKQ